VNIFKGHGFYAKHLLVGGHTLDAALLILVFTVLIKKKKRFPVAYDYCI